MSEYIEICDKDNKWTRINTVKYDVPNGNGLAVEITETMEVRNGKMYKVSSCKGIALCFVPNE